MKSKRLAEALERVENWPAEWQELLADIAFDIDSQIKDGVYHLTPEEIEAIDRSRQSGYATDEAVEQAFAKFRRG